MNTDRLKYRYWEHEDWHDTSTPLKPTYCNIVDGCNPTIAEGEFEFCTGFKDKDGNLVYEGDLLNGMPVEWVDFKRAYMVRINHFMGWNYKELAAIPNPQITGNIHQGEQG